METTSDFKAAQRIFHDVGNMPPNERSEYFRAQNVSPLVIRDVNALLAARNNSVSALRLNIFGTPIADHEDSDGLSLIGQDVGPFRIESLLGEGGVGCVYLAEQLRPIRRRVALKVIKPGMDTKQVLNRFEYERDALALLNHPNIAKVFEAGSTQQERPYFAMEYVQGKPITEYCDDRSLSIDERLEMFNEVCQAVQHAHQAGIIHRDLKPSNIIVGEVDGKAAPKVIDFGIAKAMGRGQTDHSFVTDVGIVMGTPGYMSPELREHGAGAADVRGDVYSLGVILHQLLVGCLPQGRSRNQASPLGPTSTDELHLRRPSDLISAEAKSVAVHRECDPATLRRRVRGELDWIVLKSLENDRTRRYPSVAALAAEIERHLTGYPIEARPPSRTYWFRKFVARNKVSSFAVSVAFLSLTVGLVVSQLQRNRAAASEAEARAIAEFNAALIYNMDAEQVGIIIRTQLRDEVERALNRQMIPNSDGTTRRLLTNEIDEALLAFDRSVSQVAMSTVAAHVIKESIIAPASDDIGERFATRPRVALLLHNTLVNQYIRLGDYAGAEVEARHAIELLDEVQIDSGERLRAIIQLANILERREQFAEAEKLHRMALELRKQTLGEFHKDTIASLSNLAVCLAKQGRIEEAAAIQQKVLTNRIRLLGPRDEDVASSMVSLGGMLNRLEKYDQARELISKALEIRLGLVDIPLERVLDTKGSLAAVDVAQGRYADAAERIREVLDALCQLKGNLHPKVASAKSALATCLVELGKSEEAEQLCREALPVLESAHENHHSNVLLARARLGMALSEQGRYDEAGDLLTGAYNQLKDRKDVPEHAKAQLRRALDELGGALGSRTVGNKGGGRDVAGPTKSPSDAQCN